MSFRFWKDPIALLTYERATGISKSFHVWVMEGFDGVTGSWTTQTVVHVNKIVSITVGNRLLEA